MKKTSQRGPKTTRRRKESKMVKKAFFVVVMLLVTPVFAQAYTFNGEPQNAVGGTLWMTYGMDVSYNQGTELDIYTNYPKSVGWNPADFFISINSTLWAIPLIEHDGFYPGTLYRVGSYLTSDYFYGYGNQGIPVWMTEKSGLAYSEIIGGDAYWRLAGGWPDWRIHVFLPIYLGDDWSFIWGTGICGNGVFQGIAQVPEQVPEPSSFLLLGAGLVGIYGGFKKRRL